MAEVTTSDDQGKFLAVGAGGERKKEKFLAVLGTKHGTKDQGSIAAKAAIYKANNCLTSCTL